MRGGIRMKTSYQLQDSLRGKGKSWKLMILLKNCVVTEKGLLDLLESWK
jgi:hypothetical protein